MSEEKKASSHYIINFYAEVEQLITYYAHYQNLCIELEQKYGDSIEKADSNDKGQINSASQNFRLLCISVYVKYSALSQKLKSQQDKIDALYLRIKSEYNIQRDVAEEYVIELSKFLASQVMNNLLENSMSYVQSIYGNPPTGQNNSDDSR